jgi:hypothetical protein
MSEQDNFFAGMCLNRIRDLGPRYFLGAGCGENEERSV